MEYSLVGNQVVRDDGYVAMQHLNSNGAVAKIGEITYIFTPSANVSLAWVASEHVDKMLTIKTRGNCCGHADKQKYYLASMTNVNLHVYNNREGKK
jgi:hypothetical protein